MTTHRFQLKPGKVLHAAVLGALRSRGTSLSQIAIEKGVTGQRFREVSFGSSRGKTSRQAFEEIVETAGRATVEFLYGQEILRQADCIAEGGENITEMSPGVVLHDAIMGGLYGAGKTAVSVHGLDGVDHHTFRRALCGLSDSSVAEGIRSKAIEAAGRDIVEMFYRRAILQEAAAIRSVAA